jgi:hypothetical protein
VTRKRARAGGATEWTLVTPMNFPLVRLYVPTNSGDEGRTAMARVIQFYIPTSFQRKVKWVALQQRGKVIQFQREVRKSA